MLTFVNVRIVVADDQPLVRAGLATLLGTQPGLEVVADTEAGEDAVKAAVTFAPDVMLLDLTAPAGLDVLAQVVAESPVRVLAMTDDYQPRRAWAALHAGAAGFLLKTRSPEVLVAAVRAVAEAGVWLDSVVAHDMLAQLPARTAAGDASAEQLRYLTAREREVLVLMANGLNSTEIAQRLVLSLSTVRTHVGRILMKLHCRDRTRAVVVAYRSGLVRV
jgi:DNA-binding NarL/FixJ family response regulator